MKYQGSFELSIEASGEYWFKSHYNPSHVTYIPAGILFNGGEGSIYGIPLSSIPLRRFHITFSYGANTGAGDHVCVGITESTDFDIGKTSGMGQKMYCVYGAPIAAYHNLDPPTCPECGACNNWCTSCTSNSNEDCSSCSNDYFLQPSSTTCYFFCPTGYYGNTNTNVCTLCHAYCSACTGASNTECSSCKSGYYLQPSPSSTTCLSTCPETLYYPDSSTNTCASNYY